MWSGFSATAAGSAGALKLGQPEPESYLDPEWNNSSPQAAQRYFPGVLLAQ